MDQNVLDYIQKNRDEFIKDLQGLVQIPSVASENPEGVQKGAEWLEAFFNRIGIKPIIERDANQPVFLAEVPGETPYSILVYGHYDVVPANPDEWHYPPFAGVIEDGRMYGRGTVDDKAQILAPLEAVRAYIESGKKPPVTVKFLLEGEEECGSESLKPVMEKYRDFLYCDALVNYDDCVWYDGRPRVVCGLKGGVSFSLTVKLNREFHGMMQSMMPGANWRLIWALASMVDKNGKVLIEDWDDDIVPPTEQELAAVRDLNWDTSSLLAEAGIKEFIGGKNTEQALNSFVFDSAIGVSGFSGGYVYPLQKGVIPAYATAEVRVNLVPKQTAQKVLEKVRRHLDKNGFDDVEITVRRSKNLWARTPIDSPIALSMIQALNESFKNPAGVAIQPSYAGSGPEGVFQDMFPKMEQAYSGFGPVENRLHAPDEYIVLDDYMAGIESVARLLQLYADKKCASEE